MYIRHKIKRFSAWFNSFVWRRQTVYSFLVAALLLGVVVQLSILPPRIALEEQNYITASRDIIDIAENPNYLPHRAATYLVGYISDSARFVRAFSIIFYGLCVVALYRILKRWHSEKPALLASGMFATSAFVLTLARLSLPYVVLFGWPMIIAILLWLRHGSSRRIAPLSLALVSAALFFVPGAPYFFLLLGVLFFNKLRRALQGLTKTSLLIGALIVACFIGFFVYSVTQNGAVLTTWLLLPDTINVGDIPRNILRVPSAFIYRSPIDPLYNVGRLPILDVASGGLMLVGLYAYRQYAKLERTRVMLLTAIFAIILGAMGALLPAIIIVMPFAYALIAAGISYLLDEWYRVFPKNPFARSFGLIVIMIVVLASVYYQLTRFLVVWPQTPETRNTYNLNRLVR